MQSIGQLPIIEKMLYGEDDIYHWDKEQRISFHFKAIQESFKFHYDNCLIFNRYCISEGITPASICYPPDITKIPLIPSSAFKSLDVRTVSEAQVTKVCFSSGTQGNISRVPRDDISLERFVGSVRISADQLLGLRTDAQVFNLGPDTNEAKDIWFSYVMSLLGILRPAEHYIVDNVFYPRNLIEDFYNLSVTTQPILVGPPIFFLYLMDFLQQENLALDLGSRGGFVITAGGWKNFTKQQINREEFVSRCINYFGIAEPRYIRDAYNMVELNTVIFECEFNIKHVPPWLVVESLEPETLAPSRANEMGLLAFFDPLPTSYPGFILSDDFGKVNTISCSCGRNGQTLEFCRRVALLEDRGCAMTMSRNIQVSNAVYISPQAHDKY